MANIRIDNFSGDTITAYLDSTAYTIEDEERVTVEALEKGIHTLRIHRTRVPQPTEDYREVDKFDIAGNIEKTDRTPHTQFDTEFIINLNSSKSVVTVNNKVRMKNRFGMDALFVSYGLTVSGARVEKEADFFANSYVRKKFISYQIKSALLPVGLGGLILLFMGIICLINSLNGVPLNIGGMTLTTLWSVVLLCVSIAFEFYCVFSIVRTLKIAKKYKQ